MSDWRIVRFGDAIEAKYGKALPQARRNGGEVPVYGSNGIVGWHDHAITSGPTIVIGRKGSFGEVNLSKVPCWPIDTTYFIDDPGPYDLEFLSYLLKTLGLTELDQSTAIPGLSRDQLYAIKVPVPTLEEQGRISQIITATQDKQAKTVSHLNIARRTMDRFRHAVLAAACSGRLTVDWRVDHSCDPVGPGPALSAQAAANASGAPNTDELTEVPETWGWWSIEGITDKVIDYRGRTPPNQSSGPIPHVRTTQIRDGRIDWTTDRFVTREVYNSYMTRGIPERDDVLFTMEAPMGEVGVVDRDEPFSIAQRILLMRPGDHVSGEFLALALRSHTVRRAMEYRATGTGVLGIAYKRLRSVLLPIPPVEEQREIVERTSQLLAGADRLQQRIDAARARVDRSAQAVLAKAFRGELIGAES